VNQPHHKVEEPILDDKRVVRVSAHPERDTVLFSLALVAASLLLLPELFDLGAASQVSQLWVAVALGVGFAIAELSALRFMFRRESLAFSLSELPVALSLVYLAPGPAIAARLIGAMAVIYVVRRPPTYKALLNLAMFAFEMVVAYVVFRALADVDSDHDTRVIIAAIAATAACGIVSSVVVSVASESVASVLPPVSSWVVSTPVSPVSAVSVLSPEVVVSPECWRLQLWRQRCRE